MKKVQGLIILTWLIVMIVTIKIIVSDKSQEDLRLLYARQETEINNIYYYNAVKQVLAVAAPSVLLLCVLMISYSIARTRVKKSSVHTYKIGKYNEVVVHERDLSLAAPIAMGLMNAEQLKQSNRGLERAFELYEAMAEVQSKQIRALVSRQGLFPKHIHILPAHEDHGPDQSGPVPSFYELLQTGEIARGKQMILGFASGTPRRGSFLDIYSSAVAGASGSGKTATLLYLICSGLISEGVRYKGIDPHYPHPKSLGFKTKPLWERGYIQVATNYLAMEDTLQEVEQTIDDRLSQKDTDMTPMVLVIDELAFLNRSSIGVPLAHTMERISTEGRKCAVYMLASSQSWLVARTGESSVVRDTLTSAFVHRIKPKQANLLLQDKEQADKVKKFKRPGQALLCPVNDDPVVCQIPYTTDNDIQYVVNLLDNARSTTSDVALPVASINTPVDLIDQVNEHIKKEGHSLTQLAFEVEVDKGFLSRVLNRKKPLSENLKTKLETYMEER